MTTLATLARFAALIALTLIALTGVTSDARACGLFAPRLDAKAPPRLEHERTLILYNGAAHREHFVREVRFDNTGDQAFGFVVPTPSRPEVDAVKNAPFDALEQQFGHTLLDTPGFDGEGGGFAGAAPGSRGAIGAAPAVQVLEKKRVGDFVSFVLAANDARALADWLKKNRFRISDAGRSWTERYVELGYFFVALRYDGKKKKADDPDALVSRTLRISFDTPLPFYPYAEPADAPEQRGRELQVWFVGDRPMVPLSGVSSGAGLEIVHPWSEGARYTPSRDALEGVLGADLGKLVSGAPRLQTFGDWKEQRRGFGDLVMVPATPEACDAGCVDARRPLLALLDPSLRSATPVGTPELVAPAPRGGAAAWWFAAGVGLAAAARRARRRHRRALGASAALAALLLAACGGRPPLPPPPPPGPALAVSGSPATALTLAVPGDAPPAAKLERFALPAEPAARQHALMDLLTGRFSGGLVPTWSTPLRRGIGHARNSLPRGLADTAALERRCLADDRVEAIVSYAFQTGSDGRVVRARVEGPLPESALGCIGTELGSGLRAATGLPSEGWLSLGVISPEAMDLRARIKREKLVPRIVPVGVREVSLTVGPGLPKDAVARILRQRIPTFRSCYEQRTQPRPSGSITLSFTISPGGAVAEMSAKTADVATATGLCVGNATRTLGFPAPSGGRATRVRAVLGFSR
jgi:Uncharacterized protein conserved in bacteria (DUF2330)